MYPNPNDLLPVRRCDLTEIRYMLENPDRCLDIQRWSMVFVLDNILNPELTPVCVSVEVADMLRKAVDTKLAIATDPIDRQLWVEVGRTLKKAIDKAKDGG